MERETRRSAALGRLDELVGRWELQATVEGQRMAGGRTSFDWIEDGASWFNTQTPTRSWLAGRSLATVRAGSSTSS
jgi:hypothetical protein